VCGLDTLKVNEQTTSADVASPGNDIRMAGKEWEVPSFRGEVGRFKVQTA